MLKSIKYQSLATNVCEVCPMVSAVKSVYDEPVHISLSRLLLICSVQQAVVLQGDVFYILQSGLWYGMLWF